jgi:hypothetical protein
MNARKCLGAYSCTYMETSQQASARRVELDYPCYLRTVAEWVVALALALCGGGQSPASTATSLQTIGGHRAVG